LLPPMPVPLLRIRLSLFYESRPRFQASLMVLTCSVWKMMCPSLTAWSRQRPWCSRSLGLVKNSTQPTAIRVLTERAGRHSLRRLVPIEPISLLELHASDAHRFGPKLDICGNHRGEFIRAAAKRVNAVIGQALDIFRVLGCALHPQHRAHAFCQLN